MATLADILGSYLGQDPRYQAYGGWTPEQLGQTYKQLQGSLVGPDYEQNVKNFNDPLIRQRFDEAGVLQNLARMIGLPTDSQGSYTAPGEGWVDAPTLERQQAANRTDPEMTTASSGITSRLADGGNSTFRPPDMSSIPSIAPPMTYPPDEGTLTPPIMPATTTTSEGGINRAPTWNVSLNPDGNGSTTSSYNPGTNSPDTVQINTGQPSTVPGMRTGVLNPNTAGLATPNSNNLSTSTTGRPNYFPTLSSLQGFMNYLGNPSGGGNTDDENGIAQISRIDLPNTPYIPTTFDSDFQNWWNQFQNTETGNVGDFYNQGDWGTFNPSQMDLGQVPQTQSNDALNFLLSGKGYGDDIMSLLRGQATDNLSRSAVSDRAAAKQIAQRSGLDQSGAGMALEGQVDRRLGDSIAQAKNSLNIQNAQQGLENLRMGAPMELQRATDNAARMFAAMQQNLANSQQAAGVNTQNQFNRNSQRAGAQTNLLGQMTGQYGAGALDQYQNATSQNTTNQINRGLNQAQLNRQADIYNANNRENRFGQGLNAALSLANGSNPQGYALGGANTASQYNPSLIGANALIGGGNAALAELLRRQQSGGTT